jgi:hypothetical protein
MLCNSEKSTPLEYIGKATLSPMQLSSAAASYPGRDTATLAVGILLPTRRLAHASTILDLLRIFSY